MEDNAYSFDVIVLGAGPAGLTAGMYLARAKKRTLILNEGTVGGQMVLTHEIANYPGVESISGYQLAAAMKRQAAKFGCTIRSNVAVTSVEFGGTIKNVEINGKETFSAPAVILAMGGRSRMLGVAGEEKFKGKGISYCATCDGDFFQDKDIIVVGGGNSALEEAVSLTKYARSVTIIHQFDHFQAFPHAIEEARQNPKISFIMESTVAEFMGNESLQRARIQNLVTGEITEREIDGAFIFIGYVPNTEGFGGKIRLNSAGEVVVNSSLETNVPGVFAAGDSIQKKYRQVTTAVADGTVAALTAIEYLHKLGLQDQSVHGESVQSAG
ncbi:MAG: FAD-dependent oxidoreductase [Ignavibacteriales bacterium]|nr:FAD-dependent oxidoreductase [Ignavibacteriales bacterium]